MDGVGVLWFGGNRDVTFAIWARGYGVIERNTGRVSRVTLTGIADDFQTAL